ncbi:MAG TPA: DUF4288 domain-containing protein [Candidatus Limnocylindria bacterium]|nr:DUF4288 domain-containing protein [Candidatus Limnocylindria bacterium]
MTTNGHAVADPRDPVLEPLHLDEEAVAVDPSGWFAVQLRYAYLLGAEETPYLVEDRVVLVDGDDEETALGRAVEMAPEYEDAFETEDGAAGEIRFEGIVALKELDDPPGAGTEVWHEFMSPPGVETAIGDDGEALPALRPVDLAFPRAHDD